MKDIIDLINDEIMYFQYKVDENPDDNVLQEYLNTLNVCSEILAETRYMQQNPDNYVELDEIMADETAGEKPGDKIYRHALTPEGERHFVLLNLNKNNLASWITERRIKSGLSRYSLAKKIGCHISSLTNYENGRQVPGFDKVVDIYHATM